MRELILVLLATALVVTLVVGLLLHSRLLRLLRTQQSSTWKELGRPHLWRNNTISNSAAVVRVIWRSDPSTPEIDRARRALRLVHLLHAIALLGLVFTLFFVKTSPPRP
jgi:hypothetical protein